MTNNQIIPNRPFILHGRPESNWQTCRWGKSEAGCILYASAYQNPPLVLRAAGRPLTRPTAFVPEQIEQGASSLALRRTHSQHVHVGAAFADRQPGVSSGLRR